MWHVYILKSKKDNRYYVGCTNHIERRVREHNSGYNISTKFRVPFELVYKEEYTDSHSAYLREKEIKSYKGGSSFKKLIQK